jgi:hypothetical protein
LPDIFITDKNDTFHMESRTYSSFRILARAVQRDMAGNIQLVDSITPAVSAKLIVWIILMLSCFELELQDYHRLF